MTIKGPDISSFQAGLNVRALSDPFVLMKCTEGTGYADAYYAVWLAQVKASGKIPIAYHFIGPQDPHAQAAWLAKHIIDQSVRVMVDFEDEGAFHPTLDQLLALDDAITAVGLIVKVNYFPRWKWSELGSPSLSGLTSRGIGLISSAYPGGSGYPGDDAAGWQAYGGVTPMLWQYTDVAYEGGQKVGDMNAYRGTIQQLSAFLDTGAHPSSTPQEGTDMTPAESQQLADIHQSAVDFANWQFYSPGGREQVQGTHAWRMQSTLDNTTAIKAAVEQLLARPAAAPIDETALGALIDQHMTAGADAQAIATAVMQHLSAATANG